MRRSERHRASLSATSDRGHERNRNRVTYRGCVTVSTHWCHKMLPVARGDRNARYAVRCDANDVGSFGLASRNTCRLRSHDALCACRFERGAGDGGRRRKNAAAWTAHERLEHVNQAYFAARRRHYPDWSIWEDATSSREIRVVEGRANAICERFAACWRKGVGEGAPGIEDREVRAGIADCGWRRGHV